MFSYFTLVKENTQCVKSVRIRCFSGPYFPAFGQNTERYGVSLQIQSECGKIRTKKTPNTDTFHAVTGKRFPRAYMGICQISVTNFLAKIVNFKNR